MNIFKCFKQLKKKEQCFLLYCLLDRIPIIVFGQSSEIINDFISALLNLISFRKEFIYYTDFISNSELESMIQNEYNDYNSMRVQIRCPANTGIKAIEQFNSLISTVIGIIIPPKNNIHLIEKSIKRKANKFLEIFLKENDITIKDIGFDNKLINLNLEEDILTKISEDTENSINKMKRVLYEKINKKEINKELIESLLDFKIEKKEIKKNIFRKEIQNFYSGSKRAFFILSKLNLLNTMQIDSKIGSKTLLETINYKDIPIERIISFIENEWGEDFSDLVENNKLSFIGDKIQSFWG